MIESNLEEGKQEFTAGATDPRSLKEGVSITDACVNLEQSEQILKLLNGAIIARRAYSG